MNRLNLNRVMSALAERTATVVASVSDFEVLTPAIARVIVAFNTVDAPRMQLAQAVSAAMSGDVSVIESSFRPVESMGAPAMVGFVCLNKEVRTWEESSVKKMQVMASNLLLDRSDDSLWEVRTNNGVKMLARQGEEDLSELLQKASVHMNGVPVLASFLEEVGTEREYAAFVDPKLGTVRYGYVLSTADDKITVLPHTSGTEDNDSDEKREGKENSVGDRMTENMEPVTVMSKFLVETARLKDADSMRFRSAEIAAPMDSRSNAAMKDYYRQLYSYDPKYYAEIEKQIDEHASI